MLSLALRPGQGLGPFLLGQPLPEVLAWLQQQQRDYRRVEVRHAEQDTLRRDIVVVLPEHGFQLHFEPRSQRLRVVEVFDTTRLQMVYGRTTVFGGASDAPTFGRIYEAFGPTYPGEPDAEGIGGYPLQYPGILLLFPWPAHQAPGGPGYGSEGGGRRAGAFPVPLSVPAERIYIHAGARGPPAAVLAAPPPPLDPGSCYMEALDGVPAHGLYLGPGAAAALRFGDSPQDVVSLLGQPARVVPKLEGAGGGGVPDYFYTYPSRGLDLLFSGASHRLAKLVLHTNVPGHPDFNAYYKANFRVHTSGWRPPQAQQQQQRAPSAEELGTAGSPEESGGVSPGPLSITANPAAQQRANPRPAAAAGNRQAGEAWRQEQQQRWGSSGGEGAAAEEHSTQRAQQASARLGGALSATCHMSAGLMDDVAALDPLTVALQDAAAAAATGAPAASDAAGTAGEGAGPAGGGQGGSSASPGAALAAAADDSAGSAQAPAAAGCGGRPPKPPTAAVPAPAPAAPLPMSKSSKKKAKKKKKAAAAAGAMAAEEQSDGLADASASDSGISSLASSPGLTSHIIGASRLRHPGLAGGSDWGSTADLAAKEGSVCGGSALDGWSDADDLFPMLHDAPAATGGGGSSGGAGSAGGGGSPLGRHSAGAQAGGWGEEECGAASLAAWAAGSGAPSALTAALGSEQQQPQLAEAEIQVTEEHGPLHGTVSTGVQTAADAGGEASAGLGAGGVQLMQLADLEAADGGSWEESDSPQGYVMPARPSLFDEGAGPGEYEEVPRQRDCSTQTPPPHLLQPLRTARGGDSGAHGGSPGGRAAAAAGPVVTADSTLPDIQAAFGHQGGPALHNRLGASHPFGPSYLYAYRGVVFEVLQSGRIATVTLFRP